MAVIWAFPMTALVLFGLPWWGEELIPLIALVWAVPALIFGSFPLYERRLHAQSRSAPWRQFGVGLFFWGMIMAFLAAYWAAVGEFPWKWAVASLIVCLIVCVELMGSTPVYKSGSHQERRLRISLDLDLCTGVGTCEQVCPVNVFDVDQEEGSANLSRLDYCVQCGACIVQCPLDALCFVSPDGTLVAPDTIRKFKLNLLGKRLVESRTR
jgi:ferredoxin